MRFSIEILKEKAEKMQKDLEESPGSEPNDLIDRAEKLSILVAQSGKMLADAEWYRDQIIEGTIMDALKKAMEEKLSPSVLNQYIKSVARDYNFLVKWIDRINATATHQIEAVRSILSYRKAEMVM